MLKEGKVILLSDSNKYIVTKHIHHEGYDYYYVFKATGEDKDFKILQEKDGEYQFVQDKNIAMLFINSILD